MTRQVTVEFPEEARQVLGVRPDQLPQELREPAGLVISTIADTVLRQAVTALGSSRGLVLEIAQMRAGLRQWRGRGFPR